MQEIKLSIPDGCKTVIINLDGNKVTTQFEPREEWKPKDGDVVYAQWGDNRNGYKWIFICKKTETDSYSGCHFYVSLGIEREGKQISELLFNDYCNAQELLRPATEAEKRLLVNKLADAGYRWNAEEKKLEQLPRWRAKEEQEYFYITSALRIDTDNESMHGVDKLRYECGNYFKTREVAERIAEQVREIFKNSKAE